jgi:hypothetical protein
MYRSKPSVRQFRRDNTGITSVLQQKPFCLQALAKVCLVEADGGGKLLAEQLG